MSARVKLVAAVVLALVGMAGCGGGHADAPVRSATDGLQQQFVDVVKTVSPQVVEVQSPIGLGSGVVFDDDGNVVTNAHVVEGSREFVVRLRGGERHRALLVGADTSHDIAVLHLAGATPHRATFAESTPAVGSLVLAIGNPLGLRSSVTQGIVSSRSRTVTERGGVTLSPAIQTSAAVNPGNSGGALVDLAGRVIGIPTLSALDPEMGGAQAPGIGFAIPSSTVVRVANLLIRQT